MIIPIKIVTVKANGKRYIFLDELNGKVHTKGEVNQVSGHSARHDPNKTFMADRVEVREVDLSEELLNELLAQNGVIQPLEVKQPKWVKVHNDGHRELTPHARKEFKRMGYDLGMDGFGSHLVEESIEDYAIDTARYNVELTSEGIPESHVIRECAADLVADGLFKALEEKSDI